MTSQAIRDQNADHLLTPKNTALIIIDHQPVHVNSNRSMVRAGAQPVSWVQLSCELQRDWQRTETAKPFAEILFGS